MTLRTYNIPRATLEEVLIEKSPPYAQGDTRSLLEKAHLMQKKIPNVKIIAFVCDPIKRLYSHIKMHYENEHKRHKFWGLNATIQSVWKTAERYAGKARLGAKPYYIK